MIENEPTDYEVLFDALTEEPPCESYEDIAVRTGWPISKVGPVLAGIRSPAVAEANGFTVPHVPRGIGPHLYMVVLLNDDRALNAAEDWSLRTGASSTCGHVGTMSINEAFALRTAAKYLPPAIARRLRAIAKLLDGAAVMAFDARDRVLNGTTLFD